MKSKRNDILINWRNLLPHNYIESKKKKKFNECNFLLEYIQLHKQNKIINCNLNLESLVLLVLNN